MSVVDEEMEMTRVVQHAIETTQRRDRIALSLLMNARRTLNLLMQCPALSRVMACHLREIASLVSRSLLNQRVL